MAVQVGAWRVTTAGFPLDRLDRGWGYTTTDANSRTGIERWGFTESDLTPYTGSSTIAADTTLDMMSFSTNVDLRAGGITISRSLFKPTTVGAAQLISFSNRDNTTAPPTKNSLIDCTLDGTLLSDEDASLVTATEGLGDVIGCNIHHFGSGIAVLWTSGVNISCTIESNRVYDMVSFGDPATTGNHCDGFTIRDFEAFGGRTATIQNNWVDCNTQNASGACFIQAFGGDIADASFARNLWSTGNWCVTLDEKGSTIDFATVSFDDDRMDVQGYGPLDSQLGSPTMTNCFVYNISNPPTYAGTAVTP